MDIDLTSILANAALAAVSPYNLLLCFLGTIIGIVIGALPGFTSTMGMALFIPLHPDRMNAEDWDALPGIGREIARRIEEERQKNGDFGSLAALRRVRGVGEKLINRLSPYF